MHGWTTLSGHPPHMIHTIHTKGAQARDQHTPPVLPGRRISFLKKVPTSAIRTLFTHTKSTHPSTRECCTQVTTTKITPTSKKMWARQQRQEGVTRKTNENRKRLSFDLTAEWLFATAVRTVAEELLPHKSRASAPYGRHLGRAKPALKKCEQGGHRKALSLARARCLREACASDSICILQSSEQPRQARGGTADASRGGLSSLPLSIIAFVLQ